MNVDAFLSNFRLALKLTTLFVNCVANKVAVFVVQDMKESVCLFRIVVWYVSASFKPYFMGTCLVQVGNAFNWLAR